MKQLSAKLKSRGATAVVLTLALGAAVYLNCLGGDLHSSLRSEQLSGCSVHSEAAPSRSPTRLCLRQLPGPIRR